MSKVRLYSAVWPLISLCSVYLLWNWLQSAFFVIEPQAHERNLQIFSQKATIVAGGQFPRQFGDEKRVVLQQDQRRGYLKIVLHADHRALWC